MAESLVTGFDATVERWNLEIQKNFLRHMEHL
jgi:hypothetical protein